MLYQTFTSAYPALALAGESHSNTRHTSILQTAANFTEDVVVGTAQVKVALYDHTRYSTEAPTAANLVVPSNELVLVHRCRTNPNSFVTNRIGATVSTTASDIPVGCQYAAVRRGIVYVIVEKEIDPANPVYVRISNPDASGLQGIGYFTDVDGGADTVLIDSTISELMWCGVDSATYIAGKDPNVTPELDRSRTGQSCGYGVAPLSIKHV